MFLCLSIRSLPVGNSLSPLTQLTPVCSADQMPPPPGSHLWPHHASTLLLGVCNNAPLPCFRGSLAYLAWCLTHCTVIIWKKQKKQKSFRLPQSTVNSWVQRFMSSTSCLVHVRQFVNVCWRNKVNELFKATATWLSHTKFQTRR